MFKYKVISIYRDLVVSNIKAKGTVLNGKNKVGEFRPPQNAGTEEKPRTLA